MNDKSEDIHAHAVMNSVDYSIASLFQTLCANIKKIENEERRDRITKLVEEIRLRINQRAHEIMIPNSVTALYAKKSIIQHNPEHDGHLEVMLRDRTRKCPKCGDNCNYISHWDGWICIKCGSTFKENGEIIDNPYNRRLKQ